MAPSTCQATVPIPDSEGLRRRVTACAQRPARCPPWTPACVGTGAAKASLPRRPGPEPWGTRLLRGCSLPRWPPPAAASTHTYTRPPPGRSATHLQTRVCARRPQHPGPPRPLRPPATEALELGGEAGPGREALPRGRVWGALTSPACAFHRELEDGSDGRGSRKGERGHPGSPAVSVGRGRAEGHRGWEAGRRQDIDR